MHRSLTAVFLLAAFVLGGCSPTSFKVDVGPASQKLYETTVQRDGSASDKIALIDLDGVIMDSNETGLFGTGSNPVDEFAARLTKAAADSRVRGVVIRINSPGGTVSASAMMSEELDRFKEKTGKPVVISMGDVCASGGYYVAMSGDRIIAQPTTITGSIGVIIATMNFSQGFAKIGIKGRAITSGPNKALANPFEPMNEEQYAILQGLVDDFYSLFRARVEGNRELDPDNLEMLTDGRVFTGTQAMEYGLVDQLGSIHDAFGAAKELAGMAGARLVKYHPKGNAPRSVYAVASDQTPQAGAQINLVQLSLDSKSLAGLQPGVAYYLWMP